MTPYPLPRLVRFAPLSRCSLCAVLLFALFWQLVPRLSAADAAGSVSGTVTNKNTGNGLEGAIVAVPALGRTTLVDNTGRYVLADLPAGSHELVVNYSGLDPQRVTVSVTTGARVTQNVELTSGVYVLETFKVAGEREGYAAALTAQRNADNLKNVVSMDAYGNLPNLNATELALRLPGVSFADPGEEVVEGISIRGQGMGLNTITIDGGLMASYSGQNRQSRMTAFTGAMFESLELIKGQTPDQGADSMGGRVNFKTRSPLNMRENRRTSYSLSAVWAAPFTEQIPIRREHPLHPLINVSHMQKFKIFGASDPNLAVSVNVFFSENVFGYYQTDRDFQQTNTAPAYLWDYRTVDNYNVRKQASVNTKFDFRLSPNSKFTLSYILSDAPEPGRRRVTTRYTTGSQTAQGNIAPGWTDRITVVRAVPAAANAAANSSTASITQTSELIARNQRLRHLTLTGDHTLNRLQVDWTADASRMRYRTLGPEANLQNRIGAVPNIGPNGQAGSGTNTIFGPNGESSVGWNIDRTRSDLYPTVAPVAGGLDFRNPTYWRPNQLSSNSGDLNEELIKDVRLNALYRLPLPSERFSLAVKVGGGVRDHLNRDVNVNRHQWSYVGVDALPTASNFEFWDSQKTNRNIPYWEPAMFIDNGIVKDPSRWAENRFFHEQNKYTGFRRMQEFIYSQYIQLQGKWGNFGYLGGVRREQTDTNAQQFLRNRVTSPAALQASDPAGAARADYAANWRDTDGSYTHYTPSMHVYRNFTPNLKGRVSWSTGFGRPGLGNALPNETVNDGAMTVTIGNPGLKPQTSKNWDVTLEYYFEPTGSLTVGWFHKTTKDYIVNGIRGDVIPAGLDNGYGGQYANYTEIIAANAGSAITQGWEFSYVQQFRSFSFMPAVLKGLNLSANFTMLDTHGTFTGATYFKREDVSGVIPRTGNVRLSWNHRQYGLSFLYNYTAQNIRGNYNFGAPSRNSYFMPRETVNVGASYQLRPNLKLQVDVANIFNEPQKIYRGIPDQIQQVRIQPPKITMGMQGQF